MGCEIERAREREREREHEVRGGQMVMKNIVS